MPLIEIASIKSTGLGLSQEEFEISINEDNKLESYRGLFYDFLLRQHGSIVHIGNPDLKETTESGYFSGKLINWDFEGPYSKERGIEISSNEDNNYANQHFGFQFSPSYKDEINGILQIAINSSPISKIYFLTDYQFGPETGAYRTLNGLNSFWKYHDGDGLRWNTLYEIWGK